MDKYILIKQKKSTIKQSNKTKSFLANLGFKKIHQKVFVRNNRITRKIIFKVQHLISVENSYL